MTRAPALPAWVKTLAIGLVIALTGITLSAVSPTATAAGTPRLDLKILLIGGAHQ
jgi:hypothetical protein